MESANGRLVPHSRHSWEDDRERCIQSGKQVLEALKEGSNVRDLELSTTVARSLIPPTDRPQT